MKKNKPWWVSLVIIGILSITLAGFAWAQQSSQVDPTKVLTDAGFEKWNADHPKKKAHLQTLPKQKMFKASRKGKPHYLYADHDNNALYVGNEQAYQRYKQKALELKIRQDEAQVEKDREQDFDWGAWTTEYGSG